MLKVLAGAVFLFFLIDIGFGFLLLQQGLRPSLTPVGEWRFSHDGRVEMDCLSTGGTTVWELGFYRMSPHCEGT